MEQPDTALCVNKFNQTQSHTLTQSNTELIKGFSKTLAFLPAELFPLCGYWSNFQDSDLKVVFVAIEGIVYV